MPRRLLALALAVPLLLAQAGPLARAARAGSAPPPTFGSPALPAAQVGRETWSITVEKQTKGFMFGSATWHSSTTYSKEILEQPPARSGGKPGGASAVRRSRAVTDGAHLEGKESVGGWSLIEAESFARATAITKAVPMFSSVDHRDHQVLI